MWNSSDLIEEAKVTPRCNYDFEEYMNCLEKVGIFTSVCLEQEWALENCITNNK